MLCESCRAGDPECNAWIACERQVSHLGQAPQVGQAQLADLVPSGTGAPGGAGDSTGNGCQLVYETGFDEDDPFTEPRRVLVCEVHP